MTWVPWAFLAIAALVLVAIGAVAYMQYENRRDDARNPAPEVHHDEYAPAPWPGDAFRAALAMNKRAEGEVAGSPVTFPAAEPPAASPIIPGAAGGPGTAAAAGGDPSPRVPPPPLPGGGIAATAAYAAANPGREPFAVWELDEFVEAYNAIQGGA